jgi:hypothetical protein
MPIQVWSHKAIMGKVTKPTAPPYAITSRLLSLLPSQWNWFPYWSVGQRRCFIVSCIELRSYPFSKWRMIFLSTFRSVLLTVERRTGVWKSPYRISKKNCWVGPWRPPWPYPIYAGGRKTNYVGASSNRSALRLSKGFSQ